MFITLVVVSAYSDIPQLEPIRKQIGSFKSGTGGFGLSVGDTGVVDGVAITPVKFETVDYYRVEYEEIEIIYPGKEVDCIDYEVIESRGYVYPKVRCLKVQTPTPHPGAKFLFIYLKVENVGKTKRTFPYWSFPLGVNLNEISLNYARASMDPYWMSYDFLWRGISWDSVKKHPFSPPYSWEIHSVYPGASKEGWIAFEVPEGIELEDTTLEIRGLIWRLG